MESGTGNGDSEVQRTMLELLNQLDGFEASNKIKVLLNFGLKLLKQFREPLLIRVWVYYHVLLCLLLQVLMATNRIDILDQALLRPGRIDRKIEFPNPNEEVNAPPYLTLKQQQSSPIA